MKDKFLLSSFVLTASFFIFNAANFFYHFISARFLGPEEYATIASLFSIIYILSVGSNVIQTSIAKFSATFHSKKETGKIKFLRYRGLRKIAIYSAVLFIVYLFLSYSIAEFLHVSIAPTVLVGVIILFSFVLPVNRGILQGMQKFNKLGTNLVLEGALKLVFLGISFLFGLRVLGALGAVILAVFVAFLLSFTSIKEKSKGFDTKQVYSYSWPVLFGIMSVTAMYSVDIMLVKNIFPPLEAGQYSVISLLGKIVFFGATAISLAMFSKSSELHARKADTKEVLNKALLLTFLIAFFTTSIYFVFHELIIRIIFGAEYLPISSLLGPFSIFMSLISLVYIITLYKLSTNKKRFVYLLGIFNVIQITGIYFFRESLGSIIYFLIAFSAVLLTLLFLTIKK